GADEATEVRGVGGAGLASGGRTWRQQPAFASDRFPQGRRRKPYRETGFGLVGWRERLERGTMLPWVESQSPLVIALVVFSFWYALTGVIMGVALILAQRPVAKQLKASSAVTPTPLAVILALLLAFLSSRVWTNFDHARDHTGREATALREALLLSDALPVDVRANVHGAIKRHLDFIITE